MREHGPVMPLEQKCIEPGHWLIEGHDQVSSGRTFTLVNDKVSARGGRIVAVYQYQFDRFDWLDYRGVRAA